MKKIISKIFKGLNLDSSPKNQPEGTYPFALNAVTDSEIGDKTNIVNEEGNITFESIPEDYVLIGTQYITSKETILFLVKTDETKSEIGILVDNEYESIINTDLNFKVKNQIDSVHRIRRDKRMLYFVDGLNKPRRIQLDDLKSHKKVYNINPADFNDYDKHWDVETFNLFRSYHSIPVISNIDITQNGALLAGSYTASIQYLDEDFNPTEFITHTKPIIIFNDALSKDFGEIRGSTNAKNAFQDFGPTNKSIDFDVDFLDVSFPYYRIAITEATNGSGEISKVVVSDSISTSVKKYTYTGNNNMQEATIEEIQAYGFTVETADHIEQIENRLVLANTKGKETDYCKLQRYASKIKSNLVFKKIPLSDINQKGNPKRGQVQNESVSYAPGEIYSFGVQYVFADGEVSPTYHIPGRNKSFISDMSAENECRSTYYEEFNNCKDYWGVDCQGDPLAGQPIRHHRFPLRSEVAKTLLEDEGAAGEEIAQSTLYLKINGTIRNDYLGTVINYLVNYTVDGTSQQVQKSLNVSAYNNNVDENGDLLGFDNIYIDSILDGTIQLVSVEELDDNSDPLSPASGLTYTEDVQESFSTTDNSILTTEIFGIEFSDIEIPDIRDTKVPIVGYHIVRNERTDENKTILDSAVLTPLLESTKGNYIGHGHIYPGLSNTECKRDTFAVINPEFKFNQKEYTNVDEIIHEGDYYRTAARVTHTIIDDVQPGTSYDSKINKKRDKDSDGYSLHNQFKTNKVEYQPLEESYVLSSDGETKELFYLDALFGKKIVDSDKESKEVYNLAGDNKIGIVSFENKKFLDYDFTRYHPYVIFKRNLANPYGNFRVLPYYRENSIPIVASNGSTSTCTLFNGDTYVSPMKYTTSMFFDVNIAERRTKKGVLNYVAGVLSIAAGVVVTVFSWGGGAPLGAVLVGFGLSQFAAGFKKNQMAKVYADLYDKGLNETLKDDYTETYFNSNDSGDDEIRWCFSIVSNFHFESQVNMHWRMGTTIGLTDFLNPTPGISNSTAETYLLDKVTTLDGEADGGRSYQGFAKAELYLINDDYKRISNDKVWFHLPAEYDCCGDNQEKFPHRVHYSEQSFQEELADNYSVFLPNNYKDIEGSSGAITDLFKMQNNLFIHTEDALWHLPQNLQERVTGEIISFIGAGEFFNIPPRKIVDDESGNSAGCTHKWATIKTPHGVFFIAEQQGVAYRFTGNNLEPISSTGLFNWFKNNTEVEFDRDFFNKNHFDYSYRNNPSNDIGTGFIAVYDSRKERIIISKKDYGVANEGISDDYELCTINGNTIIFNNFSQILKEQADLGWFYTGIENCRLQFEKEDVEVKTVTKIEELPNDADVIVHMDMTPSFGDESRQKIRNAVIQWRNSYAATNEDWKGKVYFCEIPLGPTTPFDTSSERWLRTLRFLEDSYHIYEYDASWNQSAVDASVVSKNLVCVSFVNESSPLAGAGYVYHDFYVQDPTPAPNTRYYDDYNDFINLYNARLADGGSFIGLLYPIIYAPGDYIVDPEFNGNTGTVVSPYTYGFLQHALSAMRGRIYTVAEIAELEASPNPYVTEGIWDTIIKTLRESNPYAPPVEDYGWALKWDRGYDGTNEILPVVQFQEDMGEFLEGIQNIYDEEVEFPRTIHKDMPGVVIDLDTVNKGWTLSYSLFNKSWTSFHSYLPNLYFNRGTHFFSWVFGDERIWKHNEDKFQTYYGEQKKFILEYVSIGNNLEDKIFDDIQFQSEAFRFDEDLEEFVKVNDVTFNKGVFYNSKQSSGEVSIINKDKGINYLRDQILDTGSSVKVDHNQENWDVNELRDYANNTSAPLFIKNKTSLQEDYFIDKIVNTDKINFNKSWFEVEPLKGKYLVVRLIFDTFDDVKLVFNSSVESENVSHQ